MKIKREWVYKNSWGWIQSLSSFRVTRSTLVCYRMANALDDDVVYSGYLLYKMKGKLSSVSCISTPQCGWVVNHIFLSHWPPNPGLTQLVTYCSNAWFSYDGMMTLIKCYEGLQSSLALIVCALLLGMMGCVLQCRRCFLIRLEPAVKTSTCKHTL